MSTPEFSYPINPPTPNPGGGSPSSPGGGGGGDGGGGGGGDNSDVCQQLAQNQANITAQCDNLHIGTPKCEVPKVFFNTAPCGFGPKEKQNEIGYRGVYFKSFDEKGILRVEGAMDPEAGESNFYAKAGSSTAFEAYMYKDGLNIKGQLAGQLGNTESCHINIFKESQTTTIDFQGATNLSREGAQIFKSQLYKQTIEGFVKKYDYNQEWFGLEADIGKSITWGGRNQSDYYKLAWYNQTNGRQGYFELLLNGYTYYHQIKIEPKQINWYAQFGTSNYFRQFTIDTTHGEDTLYYSNVIVKALTDLYEASTYNQYQSNYATAVSTKNESFVYLQGPNNGYSFLETKKGTSRCYGKGNGQSFFDLNLHSNAFFQIQDSSSNYCQIAPERIPTMSDGDKDIQIRTFTQSNQNGGKTKIAILSSRDIDISDSEQGDPCWSYYSGPQGTTQNEQGGFAGTYSSSLTLGTDECSVRSFYFNVQKSHRMYFDDKSWIVGDASAISPIVFASYTANDIYFNCVGDVNSTIEARRFDEGARAYMRAQGSEVNFGLSFNNKLLAGILGDSSQTSFDLNDMTIRKRIISKIDEEEVVHLVDHSEQFQVESSTKYSQGLHVIRGSQGNGITSKLTDEKAEQILDGSSDWTLTSTVERGTSVTWESNTPFNCKSKLDNTGDKITMDFEKDEGKISLKVDSGESKATIKGIERAEIELGDDDNKVSLETVKGQWARIEIKGNQGKIVIDTEDAKGKTDIKLREVDVCEGGDTKKMLILASAPY